MNPSDRTFSILEYRLSSPHTAEVPTMTQMGFIGPMLVRAQQRTERRARRRARLQRIWTTVVDSFDWTRRAAITARPSNATALRLAVAGHA